jgi:hypothetical protein
LVSPSAGSKLVVVIEVCAPTFGDNNKLSVIKEAIGTVCDALGPSK